MFTQFSLACASAITVQHSETLTGDVIVGDFHVVSCLSRGLGASTDRYPCTHLGALE